MRKMPGAAKSWVLADQAVVSGCSAVTQMLLAAKLGLAGYGYFSVVVIAQIFLLSLQQAGITGIYQVLFPAMNSEARPAYNAGIATAQCSLTGLLAVAGAAFCLLPLSMFSLTDRIAVVLNVLAFLQQDYYRKMLLTRSAPAKTFYIDALNNGLQLAGLLALAACRCTTLSASLWVCALSYMPALILGQVWCGRCSFSLKEIRTVYTLHREQGRWMMLSAMLQWAAGNFYMVAAGWWLGAAMLGALRLGQYLFGLLNVLMGAIESYALPRAAGIAHNPEQAIAYLKAMLRKMLAVMFPLLLLIACTARPVLRLLGKGELDAAFAILSGLSLTYLFVAIAYPLRMALRIFQLNRAYFNGYAIAAAFSLASAWSLIHAWGVRGVMAGLLFSQIILISYWLLILQKQQHAGLWKSSTSS